MQPMDLHASAGSESISDQPERAEQSCASCKRLKRRCSKEIPSCQLCSRVGRRCDYSSASSTPTILDAEPSNGRDLSRSDTPRSLKFRSDVLSNGNIPDVPSEVSSDLATCFLDSVATRGVDVSSPSSLLWRDVCSNSESISKVEALNITDRYFSTTHSWLPISMFCPIR